MDDLSDQLKKLDFGMLTTTTSRGHLASRPMSNNREVAYDGSSYYFTWADSRMAQDIEKDAKVSVEYQSGKGGGDFLFIQVQGIATVLTSPASMKDHWHAELERWFPEGVETEGLVMIRVDARRIAYWSPDGDGVITVD